MAGWGRWSNASGDPEACDAKRQLASLGGRVLIGGWVRAARQGSKLWEAQVEPLVDPGTSDCPAIIQQRCTSVITGHAYEARNMLFPESRCQVSFPFPFPIEFSSSDLNSSIHNTVQPVGRTSPIPVSSRSYPGQPAQASCPPPEKRNECNPDSSYPSTKYPARPPRPSLSTPGICTQ